MTTYSSSVGVRRRPATRTWQVPSFTLRMPNLSSVRSTVLTVGSLASGCVGVFGGLGPWWGCGAVMVAGFIVEKLSRPDADGQP